MIPCPVHDGRRELDPVGAGREANGGADGAGDGLGRARPPVAGKRPRQPGSQAELELGGDRAGAEDPDRGTEVAARPRPHVAVRLVGRAAADRVVGVVLEELPPGEPKLAVRVGTAAQRRKRGKGLGDEELSLGRLARLLQVHA